jgi:sulfane dehydrogenase subunit SoxC
LKEITMSNHNVKQPSRRAFLGGAAAIGAGVVTSAAAQVQAADPLIVNPQDWAQSFGDGVDATPYGLPIEYEADVIRRNVEWLTADTGQFDQFHAYSCTRRHNHAAGLCL